MLSFTICVTAWLSNGWMPAIMYARCVSLNRFELVLGHMSIYAWIMLVSQFVFPHDWVMDECLQSYMLKNVSLESIWVKDVDLYNYVGYVYMSESCVIAWLSNGWMPAIMYT